MGVWDVDEVRGLVLSGSGVGYRLVRDGDEIFIYIIMWCIVGLLADGSGINKWDKRWKNAQGWTSR